VYRAVGSEGLSVVGNGTTDWAVAPGPGGRGLLLTSLGPICLGPEVVLVASLMVEPVFFLCRFFSTIASSFGLES